VDTSLDNLLARMSRLTEEFQELREGLRQAVAIAEQDPEMSLTRTRKVLEFVVRDTFERRLGQPAGTRPLENLLQQLVKEGHLPRKVAAYANAVRELGNVGTHAFGEPVPVTPADVTRSLQQLLVVLEWYIDHERAAAQRRESAPTEGPGTAGAPAGPVLLAPFPRPAAPPRRRWVVAVVLGIVLLLGSAGLGGWLLRPPLPPDGSLSSRPDEPVAGGIATPHTGGAGSGHDRKDTWPPNEGNPIPVASEKSSPPGALVTASGRAVHRLEGHTGVVGGVALAPDGRTAFSVSPWDGTVRVWDAETGQQRSRQELPAGIGKDPGVPCAFSADGSRLLLAGKDGALHFLVPESGEELKVFGANTGRVTCVSLSRNGERALTGSEDGTARVWDPRAGKELLRLDGDRTQMRAVALSPDGRRALLSSSGLPGARVRLEDLEGGGRDKSREALRLGEYKSWVAALALAPDGRHALCAEMHAALSCWDVEARAERRLGRADVLVWCLAVTPDGRRALAGDEAGGLVLWDLANGQEVGKFAKHEGAIRAVAVSGDGRRAVSGGADRTVCIWALPD
jgi:hypothetical protein